MTLILVLFLVIVSANDKLREVAFLVDNNGLYEVPFCVDSNENKIPADFLKRIEKLEYHVLEVKQGPVGRAGICVKDEEIEKKMRMMILRIDACERALSQNTDLYSELKIWITWLIRISFAMAIYVFFKTM